MTQRGKKKRRRLKLLAGSLAAEKTTAVNSDGGSLHSEKTTGVAVSELTVLAEDAGRRETQKDTRLIRKAVNEGWQPTADKRTRIRDRVEARALITEDMKELKDMADLSLRMDKTNLDALRLDAQLMGLIGGRDPLRHPPATAVSPTAVNVDQPQQVIFNIPDNGRGPNGYANRQNSFPSNSLEHDCNDDIPMPPIG